MAVVVQWQNMRLWLAGREVDSLLPPFCEEEKMKILFICKYNRFRSQVAEAYFKKINKNKNIEAYSAGIFIGKPIADSVKKISKKLGFKILGKPKGIQETLLERIDLVIIVANNVPPYIFRAKSKNIIQWKIPDTSQGDLESIERISRQIMR
jgi:protein-tyrosine-phosphatase